MIEGVKFDLKSEEVKEIFMKKSEACLKMALHYEKNAEVLEANNAENESMSNSTPKDIKTKAKHQREMAENYKFWADHVIPNEIYRVTRSDLDHNW